MLSSSASVIVMEFSLGGICVFKRWIRKERAAVMKFVTATPANLHLPIWGLYMMTCQETMRRYEQPHVTPKAGLLLSLALIDMTDGKTPDSKRSFKGSFKRRFEKLRTTLGGFPSPLTASTSHQPSALGQENPGKEIHSVPHAVVVSGVQLVNPGDGASAVTSRQGISRVSFPRQTAHSRMQIIAPHPRYRDRSNPQVQIHLSLQWFRVNKLPNTCDSSD